MTMRFFRRHRQPTATRHQRRWYQHEDGTFYRNCPLIMQERKEALAVHDLALCRELAAEWAEAFGRGVIRSANLPAGDVVVRPLPFRVAYPNHPGLWILDRDAS